MYVCMFVRHAQKIAQFPFKLNILFKKIYINLLGPKILRNTDALPDLGEIHVRGIDLLNDTPVLDIKPYVPAFDAFPDARAGWMDLINPAAEDARLTGYQTIRSPRGERAARYRLKQAQTLTQETPIAEEELAGTESLHGNGGASEVIAAVEDEDSSIMDGDIHSAPT